MKNTYRYAIAVMSMMCTPICFACPTSIQHYDYLINNQRTVAPDQIETLISQCRFKQQLLTNIDTIKPPVCPPDSRETGQTQAAGCNRPLTDEQVLELFNGEH